jgi:hypothetical protein
MKLAVAALMYIMLAISITSPPAFATTAHKGKQHN